ncbi:MAG: glycosyltransferase family 117 protein [Gemmatimonadota bacterium]
MPSTTQSPANSQAVHSELDYRPSYGAAAIAAGAVLLLYIITLGSSTAMWDTSEYIAAAYTMGLPHPPGNPFFVLVGRVFSILPIAPSVAARVNLLAAICSAVSAGMWFLITERVLVSWFAERWQRIVGGSLAALIGASAFTVWSQSVVNEKVYTVALAGVALIAWLTVRWCDDPDGPRADKLLVLIAFLLGLGYSNHMAGFVAGPAAGLAVLIRRPRTLLRWKLMLACIGALVLGLTPFATQPIRAAYQPAINEGEPTGCRHGLTAECTFSSETWDAFMYNFNREQYGKPPVTERNAPFSAQVGMWWLYFKWQWWRDAYNENQALQAVLAALFLVLGLFGGWVHWKRDKQSFWFFGPLMFTLTLLLIYYLNFKYGASQAPELGDSVDREVRDRDYFYLWSFSAWSVWAALGLVFIWESVAALIGSETVRLGKQILELPRRRSWLMASPLLLVACVPLVGNWSASSKKNDVTTASFAHDLLNSVEPYGILVTVGDNDTFPLWYAQEVEGIRQDVVVANTSLLNTDWYTRQLIRNPIREYDEEAGPAIYNGGNWPKPTTPPVSLTLDQADSIPLAFQLSDTMVFRTAEIEAQITPRVLTRADIFVLQMIRDNPVRPIYFSRTAGSYGRELGLEQYLVTQGLARKLVPGGVMPGDRYAYVPGEGMVDIERSKVLWEEVFKAPAAFIRKDGWVDKPSVGIPALYVTTGFMMYDILQSQGDAEGARKALATTRQVAQGARISEFFNFDALPESILAPATPGDVRPAVPLSVTPKGDSK